MADEKDDFEKLLGGDSNNLVAVQHMAAKIPFATSGLEAPTIYADVIRGTAVMGEVTKITLIEHRVDALSDEVKAISVANLVIPTSQVAAWATYFTNLANQLTPQENNGE